jgi:hypothetical protein
MAQEKSIMPGYLLDHLGQVDLNSRWLLLQHFFVKPMAAELVIHVK